LKKQRFTMPKEITAINLRHQLGELLDRVANKHEPCLIKSAGIPAAILLSGTDYQDIEELVDTWYEQQDPTFQESLVKARQEIKAGKVATPEDVSHDLQVKERRGKKRS
jgi:prevent-host-death family protein